MAILQLIKNVGKTLVKDPIGSFKTGWKKVSTTPPNVQSNVVPFSPASGGAALIASKSKSIFGGVRAALQRATVNPFAGTTIKQGSAALGKKILGGVVTGAGIGGAFGVARYGSGVEPDFLKAVGKGATFGLAGGLSPYGAFAGGISGYGEKAGKNILEVLNKTQGVNMSVPDQTQMKQFFDNLSNKFDPVMDKVRTPNIYIEAPNFTMPNMSIPNIQFPDMSMQMPSYSPSLSVGDSGVSSILPLLLLAGGGALGFALGKKRKKARRKKKKKYK